MNHLLKTKKEFKNLKIQEIQDICIYRNELDKACFQHYLAYKGFTDLAKRTDSHKVLKDKAFNILKSPKYDGYQKGLASVAYMVFS